MSRVIDVRLAKVTIDEKGEWVLTVAMTDICEVLYQGRHPELDPFPGHDMGHRLVELGWMPDKRAALTREGCSMVDRLYLTAMAGWMRSDENSWTIPCFPRDVE